MFTFVAMPRAIELEKRTAVIDLSNRGYSILDIATRLNISVATVKRWKSRYVQELSIDTRYANCRGIPALDENERETILLKSIEDPFKSASRIRKELELTV